MLEKIDEILGAQNSQANLDSQYLTQPLTKLLSVMDVNMSYSSNDLMEKLSLKSKEGFRRNYLKPAINLNLIKMTIPNKPNSKNQRYIKIH